MIYYGIPSYKRAFQSKTIDYLSSIGVPRERILLSLQNEDDVREYTAKGFADKATIIQCEGYCVSDNRNNILDYAERNNVKRLLMLDDDVSGIDVLNKDQYFRINNEAQLEELFDFADKNNAPIWGTYPLKNAMYQKMKVRLRCIFIGTCIGFTDMSLRFDNTIRVKEDYELCLRVINGMRNSIRFDHIAVVASHKSKGGCEDDWAAGESAKATQELLRRYAGLIRENPRRKGEILMNNIG
jgi:hypothetical protein